MSEPQSHPSPAIAATASPRATTLTVIGLIVAVLCAYAMVAQADFLHFDDNSHVFENAAVRGGLSWSGIGEAFKPHASLWVPLTTLSFMTDVSLFGMNPGAMHIMNLLWHTATTVLLFFTLRRMTGAFWPSAFVAAIFGLHPLNVESVAWITERKNVLCAFFWIGSISAYSRYVERRNPGAYALSFISALLACLAKPMAVTLPFTLLLLDWWPLGRRPATSWIRIITEKLPFFALSIGTSIVAMFSRRESELVTLDIVSLSGRISNALVSYVTYLGQMIWPAKMGVFYPHPVHPEPLLASLAAVLLLTITVAAWITRKRFPFFIVGWLWFLGTLVPMIGFVQAGSQARADRFVYIPQIGVFMIIAWLVATLRPLPARAIAATAGAFLLACGFLTARQVTFWMDGATLFEHTIAVTQNNACAYANAGLHRVYEGDYPKAIEHFQASLRILPDQSTIWREFGKSLLRTQKPKQAVQAFRAGLQQAPEDYEMRYHLAIALRESGDNQEAIGALNQLLADVPKSPSLHYHLGLALANIGKKEEARAHLAKASELAPQDPKIKASLEQIGQ